MKRKIIKKTALVLLLFAFNLPVFANYSEYILKKEQSIQKKVDEIGFNILNKNKITKRMIFTYSSNYEANFEILEDKITDRQIILYDGIYTQAQTDDELAAALSREIAYAVKSYHGAWGGRIDTIQVALSPKKFETMADKRAVDYMVNADYNPLALIVFINKTCPQKKGDKISRHNLTSKRLARIYEYITYKYPQYLENNEYIDNPYYQNFLLTSIENRKKLEEKIKTNSKEELKYE